MLQILLTCVELEARTWSPQHPHGRNPDHGGMIQAEPSLIKTCWFDVVSWNHWPYSYSTWFWLVAFELFTVFSIGKTSTTKMYLNSCGYKSLTDLRFGYLSPAGEDQCLFLSCVMLPVCQHWCVNNQVNVNECRYHQALQHANSLSTGSFSAQNWKLCGYKSVSNCAHGFGQWSSFRSSRGCARLSTAFSPGDLQEMFHQIRRGGHWRSVLHDRQNVLDLLDAQTLQVPHFWWV